METALVLIIVAVAGVYVVRRVVRSMTGKSGCGCGSDCGCGSEGSCCSDQKTKDEL